jgi:tRNA threonylcarbamoyladenosine biosynthesis protein TsaB
VIILAVDTCDARGSLSLLKEGSPEATEFHPGEEPYSSWIFSAVRALLRKGICGLSEIDAFAVAHGPGSFTGVRVGLAAVKALAEVFARPVVAISRLEVLASQSKSEAGHVAAFFDAHRGQVFAGLFAREAWRMRRQGEEMVAQFEEFAEWVASQVRGLPVAWISPDRETCLGGGVKGRGIFGEIAPAQMPLAPTLGRLAHEYLLRGETHDALDLDANYVRRSDAELLWKGPAEIWKRGAAQRHSLGKKQDRKARR